MISGNPVITVLQPRRILILMAQPPHPPHPVVLHVGDEERKGLSGERGRRRRRRRRGSSRGGGRQGSRDGAWATGLLGRRVGLRRCRLRGWRAVAGRRLVLRPAALLRDAAQRQRAARGGDQLRATLGALLSLTSAYPQWLDYSELSPGNARNSTRTKMIKSLLDLCWQEGVLETAPAAESRAKKLKTGQGSTRQGGGKKGEGAGKNGKWTAKKSCRR